MEIANIGGVPQRLWFRGSNRDDPALVFVHGGPGGSLGALVRRFNAELEHHFLVVNWEQRGAGRSDRRGIPSASMRIERFVEDLEEVVELVRERYSKERVILLAHSWGTILGTLYAHRHPERVAAYVGVGQIASMPRGERLSYEFALSEAKRRGNRRAAAELAGMGPPPHTLGAMLGERQWVNRFGGGVHTTPTANELVLESLQAQEFNLRDLFGLVRGSRFSAKHLWSEMSRVDLAETHLSFEVPILFLLGRHDRVAPSTLAASYLERLRAPYKKLVWFDHSAHNPNYEEPRKFNRTVVEEVSRAIDSVTRAQTAS